MRTGTDMVNPAKSWESPCKLLLGQLTAQVCSDVLIRDGFMCGVWDACKARDFGGR